MGSSLFSIATLKKHPAVSEIQYMINFPGQFMFFLCGAKNEGISVQNRVKRITSTNLYNQYVV